jgi:UDP-galactopyranose mutase
MQVDYLIVGSGLTGATIARQLADHGREVLVVERRSRIGGNVHDHVHPSGIRIHTCGPHYFRTNSGELWNFVQRFGAFYEYVPELKARSALGCENWPIAGSCLKRLAGESWSPGFTGAPGNFEEASLAMMPRVVYEQFVRGYTEKQWGVPAASLSAALARRFDIREDDDPRLMKHRYQGIPADGYTAWITNMLGGVPVLLNYDHLRNHTIRARCLTVFTGPVDEYFGYDLGRLAYRGQRRQTTYLPDVDRFQSCGQINNPDPLGGAHIRTLEWKHMMPPEYASRIRGTVITTETPYSPSNPGDYEYPFPDQRNADLYRRYAERAATLSDVLICGRLGEYRYYDMDQAIARALVLSRRCIDTSISRASAPGFRPEACVRPASPGGN